MVPYKKWIQGIYYDGIRRKSSSTYRGLVRIFINMRNRIIFREYGRHVHWDPGIIFESPYNIHIGDRCRIKKGVELYAKPWGEDKERITLSVGNHVSINSGTFINAHNYVEIGDGCLIGKNILISDTKHNFQDPTKWVKSNVITLEGPVIIGEGCHLGFNALIFPGVTIGKHVQISMNSVVTHDLPPYCVAGGGSCTGLADVRFFPEEVDESGIRRYPSFMRDQCANHAAALCRI